MIIAEAPEREEGGSINSNSRDSVFGNIAANQAAKPINLSKNLNMDSEVSNNLKSAEEIVSEEPDEMIDVAVPLETDQPLGSEG